MALYHTYRPTTLDELIGHPNEVLLLQEKLKNKTLPNVVLLSGPSGVGKTTIARILAREIGCHDFDLHETNSAQTRGIDGVREIDSQMWSASIGERRAYVLDECHRLTADAQSALLKILEDPPKHCNFFLCTTHPTGLLPTIRTRCMHIELKSLSPKALRVLLKSVVERAKLNVHDENVLDKIIDCADGSARMALQILDTVMDADPADQIDLVSKTGAAASAYNIVQGLIWQKLSWADLAKLIDACDDEPEQIRQLVLAAAAKELLKGGKNSDRANMIITEFRESWHSCGKAGLVSSVYSVLRQK